MAIVFDIETGSVPDEVLRELSPPFVAPPHPGEFDAATVAVGNLKDPAKITEKIEAARRSHAAACVGYDKLAEEAAVAHFAEFQSKAALSPLTGRVLAIGYLGIESGKSQIVGVDADESAILRNFWERWRQCFSSRRPMIGWNIHGFDLPFLIRRSWLHGVEMPDSVRVSNDRYWHDLFVDLMQKFSAGEWRGSVKLDVAAKFLGCGQKNGHGADFSRLWFGTPEERQQAVAYLENDLAMTAAVAKRMGVV